MSPDDRSPETEEQDRRTSMQRRALNLGFGTANSRGIEIAAVPVLFGLFGWFLDNRLGTSPLFLLGLVIFSTAGTFVKLWIGYDAEMRRQEAELFGNDRIIGRTAGKPGKAA